jgi:hypothetical protein
MFCTLENQIFAKDVFLRNTSYRQLIAIKIPFYFFVTRVRNHLFSFEKKTIIFI